MSGKDAMETGCSGRMQKREALVQADTPLVASSVASVFSHPGARKKTARYSSHHVYLFALAFRSLSTS
jgi:hypothetical protein